MRLYDLRHGYATILLEETGNLKLASVALGHSSVQITGDTYAHVTTAMRDQGTAAIAKALRKAEPDA